MFTTATTVTREGYAQARWRLPAIKTDVALVAPPPIDDNERWAREPMIAPELRPLYLYPGARPGRVTAEWGAVAPGTTAPRDAPQAASEPGRRPAPRSLLPITF